MQDYPHRYKVKSIGANSGTVALSSPGIPALETAPPAEFGGPGNVWSPETLLAGAVADCYILSFRAVSQARKFEWINLECDVDAILDKPERLPYFTKLIIKVKLTVATGSDVAEAEKHLLKSKDICLITNSLKAEKVLEIEIIEV